MNRVLPAFKIHSLAVKLSARTVEADCLCLITEGSIVTCFNVCVFNCKIFERNRSAVFAKSDYGAVFGVLVKSLAVFGTERTAGRISGLAFNYKWIRQIVKNPLMIQTFVLSVRKNDVNVLIQRLYRRRNLRNYLCKGIVLSNLNFQF